MYKRNLWILVSIVFSALLLVSNASKVKADDPPVISNIITDPLLDVSSFSPYSIYADISNYLTSLQASITINGLNGNVGDGDPWDYYVDGTSASSPINLLMNWQSGVTWKSQNVYPDYIYPEIFFVPSITTWGNLPLDINNRRNNYSLLHLNNPFSMVSGMSFWIEINADPVSTVNSADLLVYLVKKAKAVSVFNTDWRNSSEVELVGTINRSSLVHHSHGTNSSHHLIALSTNADGTVGTKNLDISDDFWVILYNTSPNTDRGWNLRYQPSNLCTMNDRWYLGNFAGWTTNVQPGCPDTHVHVARRDSNKDGVKVDITAGVTTTSETFYFNTPQNLAPTATSFINPLAGAYEGNIAVSWDPATDPNGDAITYNLYLESSTGEAVATIESSYGLTTKTWDSTSVSDGNYRFRGQVCDATLCTNFYSENFSVLNNPTENIYSISSISIASSNDVTTFATVGDTVSITFSANGILSSPAVEIYSGGDNVSNTESVVSLGGNVWKASFVVNEVDTYGEINFLITATNLDAEYKSTTDGSSVLIGSRGLNSSVSASGSNVGSCSDKKITGIPDLFQIDMKKNQATLYFTPLVDTQKYYVSFSENKNALGNGEEVTLGDEGVQKHTVYLLKPNTKYYFMVRGNKNCVSGEWSNTLEAITQKTNRVNVFYKRKIKTFFPNLIKNIVKKEEAVNSSKSAEEETIKSQTEVVENKKQEKTKRCILWWCF